MRKSLLITLLLLSIFNSVLHAQVNRATWTEKNDSLAWFASNELISPEQIGPNTSLFIESPLELDNDLSCKHITIRGNGRLVIPEGVSVSVSDSQESLDIANTVSNSSEIYVAGELRLNSLKIQRNSNGEINRDCDGRIVDNKNQALSELVKWKFGRFYIEYLTIDQAEDCDIPLAVWRTRWEGSGQPGWYASKEYAGFGSISIDPSKIGPTTEVVILSDYNSNDFESCANLQIRNVSFTLPVQEQLHIHGNSTSIALGTQDLIINGVLIINSTEITSTGGDISVKCTGTLIDALGNNILSLSNVSINHCSDPSTETLPRDHEIWYHRNKEKKPWIRSSGASNLPPGDQDNGKMLYVKKGHVKLKGKNAFSGIILESNTQMTVDSGKVMVSNIFAVPDDARFSMRDTKADGYTQLYIAENASVNGKINQERFFVRKGSKGKRNEKSEAWHFLGANLNGSTWEDWACDEAKASKYGLFSFDGDWQWEYAENEVLPGKGYVVFVGSNYLLDFEKHKSLYYSGIPLTEEIEVDIYHSETNPYPYNLPEDAPTHPGGWNFLANPYTSDLSLIEFFEANDHVLSRQIYVLVHENNSIDGGEDYYDTSHWETIQVEKDGKIHVIDQSENQIKQVLRDGQYIRPGQGFMVKNRSGASAKVIFKPEMRRKPKDF